MPIINYLSLTLERIVCCNQLVRRIYEKFFGPKSTNSRDKIIAYDKQFSRIDLINILINKYKYSSYLEIGVSIPSKCFDLIKVKTKHGVDPDPSANATYKCTSNEFFASNKNLYDIIFIDGLHHANQVELDIENSLKILAPEGTIVCHDMNPAKESHQLVPSPKERGTWNGNCWEAWIKLRSQKPNLTMFVINADHGLGVIQRGHQEIIRLPRKICWCLFARHREDFLNLIPTNEFESALEH